MDNKISTVKYPYIPAGKSIFYTDISNKFMDKAKEVARHSNEQQQPTGAVIVCNGEVISEASNKNPLSGKWAIDLHRKYCIRKILNIKSGEKYWLCPGCAAKESHAESRAAKQIKGKVCNGDLELYLWGHWWCCDTCWNNMINNNIKRVYLLENSEVLFNPKKEGNIVGKAFN